MRAMVLKRQGEPLESRAVEGTFSLGVAPWVPTGGDHVPLAALEDIAGSFRLKRIADDTPLPF